MGKNRVRPKKGQPARWLKGQSSTSNPSKDKHRSKAKALYHQSYTSDESGGGSLGAGKLTAAALMRHDALQGDADTMNEGLDKMSINDETLTLGMTNKTFDTFASEWTQCTNIAFDKLMKKFQLKNAHHKDMLAVLAAVTEIIKEQGGAESETEYFAALMSTLEVSDTVENLSAVLRLLSLVIRKVPKEVLIKRCSQVNQLLLETLTKHAESTSVPLIRGLLGCLSHVLRVQPASSWSQAELTNVYQCILTYVTHTKPKIRKAGQHACLAVLTGGEVGSNGIHPAATQAAQYCLDVIKNAGPSENSVLYMMVLLKSLLPTLPRTMTKQCCETILKLCTLGTKYIVSAGFGALFGLFSGRPIVATLPEDLNGQLISALYSYKPNVNDAGPIIAWLAVQQEGILNMCQLNLQLAQSHLHKFCSEAVTCWASTKPDVVKSSGLALRAVIKESMKDVPKDTCLKVVEEVMLGLKYQYSSAWITVLAVLATLTETVGAQHPTLIYPVLKNVAEIRGNDNMKLEKEVDYLVGRAVASMGPRAVLEAVPLNITGDEQDYEFRRSWLLPVLRDHISRTELAFFVEYFLPLAARFLDRSNFSATQSDAVGQKTYEVLTYQIWSLLPGFCNSPTDLASSFKNLAKILGTQLASRKEIRLDILTGLRHLVSCSLEVGEDRAELARFAKNFLPILFNLYTTKPAGAEEAGQRLAALETVKIYLKVSDSAMVENMFDKAMARIDTDDQSFTKEAILDLLRCLLVHVDSTRILALHNKVIPFINAKDHKEQKKAYKILEEICKIETEAGKQFLQENLTELQSLLLTSLSKTSPSSQYPRLKCLISILSQLQEPQTSFAEACIPEAILCIKAVNKNARECAYMLLTCLAETLIRWNPDNQDNAFRDFCGKLMSGLKEDTTTMHCSILAICKIFFHFKDIIPQDLTELILENIVILMGSSTRQVCLPTLSFVKVFITSTPISYSTKFLPNIMKGLTEMPEDLKRHTRIRTKFLLDRMCRKYGHDLITSLVPKKDLTTHKRLKNIRKGAARKDRQDGDDGDSADDDDEFSLVPGREKTMEELLADSSDDEFDDEDMEYTNKKKKVGKAKKDYGGAYIQEGDEVLDLLSPQAAQNITTTKPTSTAVLEERQKYKKAKKDAFKMTADGKLIISDKHEDKGQSDSDDEDNTFHNKKKKKNNPEGSDDEEDTFESLVATKKRKIGTESGSVKSRMSASTKAASSYKPGGSGIHRSLAPGSEYKSKKARGDVKLKGKPDPFAYIPMSHKSLNKRKAVALKKNSVFKSVIKGAKKGAMKGSKYKNKFNKMEDIKKRRK